MHLPPTPTIDGLDTDRLDELRDLDPGSTSYLDRAIGNFEHTSTEAVPAFRTLIAEGDAAKLRTSAHRLLGSALNLGALEAARRLRALEECGTQGALDTAADLMAATDEALREARAQLAAYRSVCVQMIAEAQESPA